MSIPFLLGPIPISASFMIVTVGSDNVPAVLASNNLAGVTRYTWVTNLDNLVSTTQPATLGSFLAKGDLNSLTITDTIAGVGLGITGIAGANVLIGMDKPTPVTMTQTSVANWNPPNLFLASIPYKLTTTNGSSVTIGQYVNPDLYIIPFQWYFTCPVGCCSLTTANEILPNLFCLFNNTSDWCVTGPIQTYPITDQGWTNPTDCKAGVIYTYCPVGANCGTSNCNGPCPQNHFICELEDSQFACEVDPNRIHTKWWESAIFIGGVIGLGLLVIFFIVLIFIVSRHGKSATSPIPTTPTTTIPDPNVIDLV